MLQEGSTGRGSWTQKLESLDSGASITIGGKGPHAVERTDAVLRGGLSNTDIVDAVVPLERLRARKTPLEIKHLRAASDRVVEAMLATLDVCKPGVSKIEIAETLRREASAAYRQSAGDLEHSSRALRAAVTGEDCLNRCLRRIERAERWESDSGKLEVNNA